MSVLASIPPDYLERVYAGVLGKMVGVYLGRPFEGWSYERIMAELGEIYYYVNERMPHKPPLVVTDDDLAGTFVFLRALPDHGDDPNITPAQIGDAWLNALVENRTILWWGGLGVSTEHTAYLRLKQGVRAPQSGSLALNGKIVAEQIGAQIFIDGWAMVCPGDPEQATDLARRAASVSHDGEAVYGAQIMAAMEALAFVEPDIDRLIDEAVRLIPADSVIYRLIQDVRDWHAGEPDWRCTRARIAGQYGYDRYRGVCHMVPNHALIFLGLLYGEGDFQRSMTVVNTAGWDTDCNAGNLGCLLGIRSGLAAFAVGPDWLGPIRDRLFLVSAEGGETITDALRTAYSVANSGRALAGLPPLAPKGGARFHFEGAGSVQGFQTLSLSGSCAEIENVPGHSRAGTRALALRFDDHAALLTPTFIFPHEREMPGYDLQACPTLYPGQRLRAGLSAGQTTRARLRLHVYNAGDALEAVHGPLVELREGEYSELTWHVPDTGGQPIAEVGIEAEGSGLLWLDYLTWEGEPDVELHRPPGGKTPAAPTFAANAPNMWRRAWVNGVDQWNPFFSEAYHLAQNSGRGLLIQGTRQWRDYTVRAAVRSSLMQAGGLAARVQGMRRYYALLLCAGGTARLVKMRDREQVLAERPFAWEPEQEVMLKLQVQGTHLRAWLDGELVFDLEDPGEPLLTGAVALVIECGQLACDAVAVRSNLPDPPF
jgi:ADP-ribosylglycohydrolase